MMAADYSTPEGALQSLEQAYIAHDIEAAVAAKNFQYEGKEMLSNLQIPDLDAGLIGEAAKVLELSFRKHLKDDGFPQFVGLKCRVVGKKDLAPDLVELSEECVHPDGSVSKEVLHAARTDSRWGIVVLPPDKA